MRHDRPLFRTAWLAAAFCLAATPAFAGGGSHGGSHSGSSGGSRSGSSGGSHAGPSGGSRSGSHSGSSGGARSGSTSGSRSGSHAGARANSGSHTWHQSGSRYGSISGSRVSPSRRGSPSGQHQPGPGHRGGHPGPGYGNGHGYWHGTSYHRWWAPPLLPFWGYPWYGGGCTWLWSDWNCWAPGPSVLVIGDRPDVWGAGAYEWDPPEAEDSASHLVFDVSPEDAVVYVDDEFAGMAFELGDLEGGLAVDPGEHVVTIVRPGFEGATVKIEVQPGDSGKVEIDLEESKMPAPALKPAPVLKPATSA